MARFRCARSESCSVIRSGAMCRDVLPRRHPAVALAAKSCAPNVQRRAGRNRPSPPSQEPAKLILVYEAISHRATRRALTRPYPARDSNPHGLSARNFAGSCVYQFRQPGRAAPGAAIHAPRCAHDESQRISSSATQGVSPFSCASDHETARDLACSDLS